MKILKKIIKILVLLTKKKTFGFVSISNIITNEEFAIASDLIKADDQLLINSFETEIFFKTRLSKTTFFK